MTQDNSKTVFIVDDEPTFCAVCAEVLQMHDYRVESFYTAVDFLDKASLRPDLIVMDMHLNGALGHQLIEAYISKRPTHEVGPFSVLFVSGAWVELEKLSHLNVKQMDYLVKPFPLSELLEKVKNLTQGSKP